jgi:LacI family transcriptional regulator/LacI family purine nucleotide synthesis repressor
MMTIRDVAKIAGVSRSTVSLVLNNSPLVKDKTSKKVLDVIKELDYVPNDSARSLSRKVTHCLGIIVVFSKMPQNNTYEYNFETGIYSYDISTGIFNVLADSKYKVLTERFCVQESRGRLPKLIKDRLVDGAFIVGSRYDEPFIDLMLSRNIPLVVAGGQKETKVDSVSPDPGKGVILAANNLAGTGHKRICLVNAPRIYRSSIDRQTALEKVKKNWPECISWSMVYSPYNTGEGGYIASRELLESGVHPDGIIAGNTLIAMGILRYLYEKKIRVPDDVSIIAYEDSIISGYSYPAMSAINMRKEYMGEIAASLLLERMKNPDKELTSIVADPFLVLRDSVRDRRQIRPA